MLSTNDCDGLSSLDDLPGSDPGDEDDVLVEHLAKALERTVTDESEPAACESLAGDLGGSGRIVDSWSICHVGARVHAGVFRVDRDG